MFGKYILHQKIGEGGYSSVFKCTDEIGIRYVCKQLPKLKNKRDRIETEIRIMKKMNRSPKIVHFIDAAEDADNFYIVQEWCRGGDVKAYFESSTTSAATENTVASVIRGTLRGLVHLHAKGIIHRDIKPANIFLGDLSPDADVKIGDLGTCIEVKDPDTIQEVEELVGTPWYMGPENLVHDYCAKSDIWSVGVMTYQLLVGKMPFNDYENPYQPNIALIWKAILMKDPKFSKDVLNPDAIDFIKVCLQKDAKMRPSAKEALNHPWLTKTDCSDRFKGTPLNCSPFEYAMNAGTVVSVHGLNDS